MTAWHNWLRVRIALYHGRLPEPTRKPGGVEVYVDRLADALAIRGHDVTVFTFAAATSSTNYELVRLAPAIAGRSRVMQLYLAPWLFNVRPFGSRFDVAHLHGDDWFYLRRQLPTVRTFHGSALLEAFSATSAKRTIEQTLIFGLELFSRSRADAAYGVGPDSRAIYRTDGVLNIGIDPATLAPAPDSSPTILFVGSWEGRKRGRLLHEVFQRQIRPACPDAQLWMVSDHAEPGPGITWFNRPSDDELSKLFSGAWTFCLPSKYEGFGLPYLEAMSRGLPIVSSANSGALDLLRDSDAGVIVDDDDLGKALLRSLRDDDWRETARAAGRTRAARFGWDAMIEQHLAAYELARMRFAKAAEHHAARSSR